MRVDGKGLCPGWRNDVLEESYTEKNVLLVRFGGIEQNSTLFVRNEIVTVLGLGKSREIIKPKVCYAI